MTADFKTHVIDMIARMGPFQKLVLCILLVHNFNVSINHTVTSFHTYRPKFYCRDNNDSHCTGDCPGGYVFESKTTTVVTEFSLVCSRKALGPLLNSLYFAGVTTGAIVCGILADIYGRKIMVILCLYIQGILGVGLYFIHSLAIIMVSRLIQGFFVQGLQGCTYALMMEQCKPKLRTLAGATWQAVWGVAVIYLATCSYFIPDWHKLQLALAIPTFITIFWIWLIPESLTWLITRNRTQTAYKLALKMGRWNRDEIFLDEMKSVEPLNRTVSSGSIANVNIYSLYNNRILRIHAYIMTTMWFSSALAYYGILFFLPGVAGERHLNFVIGAVFEIVSCFIAFFVFGYWGRRIPMAVYQFLIALFCFTISILSIAAGADGEKPGNFSRIPITILAIVGKALAVAAFCGMFIYAGECFPTTCRGAAMGLCGFFARFGCLLSPQISLLAEYTFKSFPLLVVAVMITLTGAFTLLLPETLGITLPNTIEDVESLWGK